MNVKIPVKVEVKLKHTDVEKKDFKTQMIKWHLVSPFAKKTIESYVTIEVPQNFLDILKAFDKGTSRIAFDVRGSRELMPGEDGDPNV